MKTKSSFSVRFLSVQLFSIILALTLVGCGGDKSVITSGGGDAGVSSDGGSSSAVFAGTYQGEVTLSAQGDEVDNTTTNSITLVVRTDGTASITIDGDTIEGFISGNNFGFSIVVIEEDGLVECSADAIVTGTISSGVATGSVSGSGDCEILTAKTGFDVSGSLTATRT